MQFCLILKTFPSIYLVVLQVLLFFFLNLPLLFSLIAFGPNITPRLCLDVRPYILTSIVSDSCPIFLEIDLLFYIWWAYFTAHWEWLLSFCQYELCHYSWQFLLTFCIVLCTWQSSSLLGPCCSKVLLILSLLLSCYLVIHKYFLILGPSFPRIQHFVLLNCYKLHLDLSLSILQQFVNIKL